MENEMETLVVGATGMTGRFVVKFLLEKNHKVRIIVRSPQKLEGFLPAETPNLTVINASLLDLSDAQMAEHVSKCDTIVQCLGHTMNCTGICCPPRDLCTQAVRRLCAAAGGRCRFILMNTTGVSNPDEDKARGCCDGCLLCCLRWCIPPHYDNETAVQCLLEEVGKDGPLEWVVVRPDDLIDDEVSEYTVLASPPPSLTDGKISTRANVAQFMVDLLTQEDLWGQWKFRMPVIINAAQPN